MQLDATRIAVRERNLLDILDLGLLVIRAYAVPLAVCTFIGVLPLFLINLALIGWMVEGDYVDLWVGRYLWLMILLVYIETPLASVPVTLYLGQAMFMESPTLQGVWDGLRGSLSKIFFCQVLMRGILPVWILLMTLERYEDYSPIVEFLIPCVVFVIAIVRAVRPFLTEIILLERNPLRARDESTITVRQRNSSLHAASGGDLLARWLGSVSVAVLMTLSFVMSFMFMSGVFFGSWEWSIVMVAVCVPVSMWLVAAYFNVVRFLSYLDLRIRHEGWEVELKMRAEAARLTRHMP